ncbi:MAG: hypothetical protein V4641_09860 [Pseudomonadota bacterium]
MTRASKPDAAFQKFGSYKWELDKELLKNFGEACDYMAIKKTDALRYLMTEFVDEIRQQILDAAKK